MMIMVEDAQGRGMSAAEAIGALMTAWNRVESAARKQFPAASNSEIYEVTKHVMNASLNLPKATGQVDGRR